MARVLVLQHSPYEPLGIIIKTLKEKKIRLRYVNFHRNPDVKVQLKGYDGLIILGGQMNPDQLSAYPHLSHEIELIQQAVQRDIPVLGICLGSQLLNLALGGQCITLPQAEIGWTGVTKCLDSKLFNCFSLQTQVFQWHQYASLPPEQATIVLENACCTQAFTYREQFIGLQFHLETDADLITRWLEHPNYLTHLKSYVSKQTIETMKIDTQRYLNDSIRIAQTFFENFTQLFDKTTYSLVSMHGGKKY